MGTILLLIIFIYLFITTINYKILTMCEPPSSDADRKVIMTISLVPIMGTIFAIGMVCRWSGPKIWPAVKRLLLKIENTGGGE